MATALNVDDAAARRYATGAVGAAQHTTDLENGAGVQIAAGWAQCEKSEKVSARALGLLRFRALASLWEAEGGMLIIL